jgi:hypothetical protein
LPARPARHRLLSGSCSSARSFDPRFLPTLGRPRAVALHFARCDQLATGLTPVRVRPCWAHKLPTLLQKRRFPAQLLARLNSDSGSPLRGKIRTPTTPSGIVQDNSILKMLENSLSDGLLYRYRDPETNQSDVESMLQIVKSFWKAASIVFPKAWGLPPAKSRLMHGAGIVSMGYLMDAIGERFRDAKIPHEEQFRHDLLPLVDVCRWTDGYWDFGPGVKRKWNEVQNTPKDIQMLANYLMVQYKALVWSRPQS